MSHEHSHLETKLPIDTSVLHHTVQKEKARKLDKTYDCVNGTIGLLPPLEILDVLYLEL